MLARRNLYKNQYRSCHKTRLHQNSQKPRKKFPNIFEDYNLESRSNKLLTTAWPVEISMFEDSGEKAGNVEAKRHLFPSQLRQNK